MIAVQLCTTELKFLVFLNIVQLNLHKSCDMQLIKPTTGPELCMAVTYSTGWALYALLRLLFRLLPYHIQIILDSTCQQKIILDLLGSNGKFYHHTEDPSGLSLSNLTTYLMPLIHLDLHGLLCGFRALENTCGVLRCKQLILVTIPVEDQHFSCQ